MDLPLMKVLYDGITIYLKALNHEKQEEIQVKSPLYPVTRIS